MTRLPPGCDGNTETFEVHCARCDRREQVTGLLAEGDLGDSDHFDEQVQELWRRLETEGWRLNPQLHDLCPECVKKQQVRISDNGGWFYPTEEWFKQRQARYDMLIELASDADPTTPRSLPRLSRWLIEIYKQIGEGYEFRDHELREPVQRP